MIQRGRITLRHVREPDLHHVERARSDPVAFGEHNPSRMQGPEAVRKRFAETGYAGEDSEMLLICDADQQVIGQVMHFVGRRYTRARELGWMIYDPAHRGQGLATEAVRLLIDYLFRSLEINRLQCSISPDNEASLRLARRCGFQFEGCARGLLFVDGHYIDSHDFGLLRSDWQAAR
jgi:ribosomal-protein-alanine N-acetyltransferase